MFWQLATPKRKTFTDSSEDLVEATATIQHYNGVLPFYRTLYNFDGGVSSRNAVINKIFFDFDCSEDNRELIDVRRFDEYLTQEGIMHSIFFSGRGFHIYTYTEPISGWDLKSPSGAIRNCWTYFVDKLSLCCDPATKDIMRVSRIPNTINIKSGLYCIPLLSEELQLSRSEIETLARKPRKLTTSYRADGVKIDLNEYDCESIVAPISDFVPDYSGDINFERMLKVLPSCLVKILLSKSPSYNERFILILGLREMMFTEEEADSVLEEFLDTRTYKHCVSEEGQLRYLYSREDLGFPNCRSICESGLCVEGCKRRVYYEE